MKVLMSRYRGNKLTLLNETKMKIDMAHLCYSKGAQVRSREKWIDQGEKNNKYFLGLEKSRSSAKIMTTLTTNNGEQISQASDIHAYITDFYSNIYTQKFNFAFKRDAFDKFTGNLEIPKLSEVNKTSCECPILEDELEDALKRMKKGSSPGCDGLTTSLYKFFWEDIGDLVYKSFKKAFEKGELSLSQRRAIIIMIHKGKGLDRDELGNWRPISLTNTNYKILAKTLAIRLQSVIHTIIDEYQKGYIKGRNISTIIKLVDDVVEIIKYKNINGGIVALDYCKAFDSINKNYLRETLTTFDFGPNFKAWIAVLLNNTMSSVQHAGWLSEWFPTQCGIRQGCPASPLIFILAVELLALKIRQNERIRGIILHNAEPGNELKIQQFADDITVSSSEDFNVALNTVDAFSTFSGLNLNKSKCEGLWLGKQPAEGLPKVIKWCPPGETIKILGINFSATTSFKK